VFIHQGPVSLVGKDLHLVLVSEGPVELFRQVGFGAGPEEKHFVPAKDIGILDDIGGEDGGPERGDFEKHHGHRFVGRGEDEEPGAGDPGIQQRLFFY